MGAGAVLAAPAVAWADSEGRGARLVGAVRAAMAVMPAGPVLLNSFVVDAGGDDDFDRTQGNAAYVYDNALAGLLLVAAGDEGAARRIGEALAIAQGGDRFYRDGRLRNAYAAGTMSEPAKLPGWWDGKAGVWVEDAYQVGSQVGPVAWAMLLWGKLGMHDAANRAGDWLDDQLRAGCGYYGGFYGWEPRPLKLMWQSTEQNTDLVAAFGRLRRAEDAGHARGFVVGMFDVGRGVFGAGLGPDGSRNGLLAADAGTWPYLAGLGSSSSAMKAIAGLRHGGGIGFSAASDGIWLEGTAFASLVLARRGDVLARVFRGTIAGNVAPCGYVYATVGASLATGLTVGPSLRPGVPARAFDYYRRPALAPTAWAGLAALDVNPLAG